VGQAKEDYEIKDDKRKYMPPKPPVGKNQRLELRLAEFYIKEINQAGRMTIRFREEVNLMNEGKRIDPDMMTISFNKVSDEVFKFEGWEMISYDKMEVHI
jgi:hypothetical protein